MSGERVTEAELQAMADRVVRWRADMLDVDPLIDETVQLVAEVRRLQALVLQAEWQGGDVGGETICPWCAGARYPEPKHAADCPAFSARGVLR